MQVRGVIRITIALFLGITALVLHLYAMRSPRWKVTKRDRSPAMAPVNYGLWKRCELTNVTIIKQGVPLGLRPNVQVCRPNHYMRYSVENFDKCYYIRRNCPVVDSKQLAEGCSCGYLPSTKGLQWLTILAAFFLFLGLIVLYFKLVTTSHNKSANLLFGFGPFICFLLTLLLMVTTLILFGAYLRRDTYEDYTFPLTTVTNDTNSHGFELFSLRNYAKRYASTFSKERYAAAVKELRKDADETYHTAIGWAAGSEIIATVLLFIVTAIAFLIGTSAREEDY